MPRALGISVAVDRKRPSATVVVIDGPAAAPTVVEAFPVTTSAKHTAAQAHDVAVGVRNRLHGLKPDLVLIRRADHPPRPSNQEGPRLRLIVEGACAAAASDVVANTVMMTGREAAVRAGVSKDELDAAAAALVDAPYVQAAAAALAALS